MAALSANWQHCASPTSVDRWTWTPYLRASWRETGSRRNGEREKNGASDDDDIPRWNEGTHDDDDEEEEEAVGQMASLPRARESVRAIAIIDFPFFPTAGNASLADLTLPSGADFGNSCPTSGSYIFLFRPFLSFPLLWPLAREIGRRTCGKWTCHTHNFVTLFDIINIDGPRREFNPLSLSLSPVKYIS